jgi:hypothetical protein
MAIMEVDGVIMEGAATTEGVAMAEGITEDFVELRPLTVQVTFQRTGQTQTISWMHANCLRHLINAVMQKVMVRCLQGLSRP